MRWTFTAAAARWGRLRGTRFGEASCLAAGALAVAILLALGGCATPRPAAEVAPTPPIAEAIKVQVDSDIGAASRTAGDEARKQAGDFMERWMNRVRQRTEESFIPWYSSYWTQQWLAVKVAWYKLNAPEGDASAAKRLAAYLEEQYKDRVLAPVAGEIDPDQARWLATMVYVQHLGEQLQDVPRRYGISQRQFDQRLQAIPAIALDTPAGQRATLYEVVHATPVGALPALGALVEQAGRNARAASSANGMSPVAERAAENLVAKLAISGGAGAAAKLVGGVVGLAVSAGAAGFSAFAHENERHDLEVQLRASLNAALDERWDSLMDDPVFGVMAAVRHMAGQIDGSLIRTATQPVYLAPAPGQTLLPAEAPPGEHEN